MRSFEINRALARFAAGHHGLVHEDQVAHLGIDRQALHVRARNGQLEAVDQGVLRVAGAPATWEQRALAAVWATGPGAVLSQRAAALLWGLDGIDHGPIEVLVDRWTRRPTRPQTKVHEARDLAGADRTERRAVPCTSVVRTLLDLPAVVHHHRVDQAFEDALRKRLCTVGDVAHRFVQLARRGRPGTVVMRRLIGKRLGGRYVPTMSEFERRTSELAESVGLPRPVRQHAVVLGGTTAYIDLAWPDRRLAVECDGLFDHAHSVRLPWDERRQNELVLRGWLVLRFTWAQVHGSPGVVVDQLLAAYHRPRPGTGVDRSARG